MRNLAFWAAIVLVVCGLWAALGGIMDDHEKPFIVGLVLMFGAGVFAILFLGTRRRIE